MAEGGDEKDQSGNTPCTTSPNANTYPCRDQVLFETMGMSMQPLSQFAPGTDFELWIKL